MNVKRIGSVLMVGLVLLSAMVVLVGTAAAATRWEIQFEGTISGVGAGVPVVIERTEGGYTETWSDVTDSFGYFKTERKQYGLDVSQPQPTCTNVTGTYQIYINGIAGESKYIGLKGGYACIPYGDVGSPPPCTVFGEEYDASGFTWFQKPCYYMYRWQQGEIPEFSTIAIPIASILGLLFFFNHRKHRKA